MMHGSIRSPKSLLVKLSLILLLNAAATLTGNAQNDSQKKNETQDSRPILSPANPYREVTRESLLNGMHVISLGRTSNTTIKLDLVIKGGAKFDLAGKTGLAKLTQETLLAV